MLTHSPLVSERVDREAQRTSILLPGRPYVSGLFQCYSSTTYRQDIQGVRALGALLIMVYHLWLNKVSGGVDVFFVVSGFFMANILLSQLATEGRVQPLVFWGKLIRRIAPSAYTVLVATLLLGLVFTPETQWVGLINEVIYSAFHVENLHLMRSSVDYLAREAPPSAVQQFWALSIQIQFYLIVPIVFMIAARVGIAVRAIFPLILAACGVVALSLAYSVYSTLESPESAYFNPATRIWEFFSGVLVALTLPYLNLRRSIRNALGLIGLVTLLLAGLVIPKSTHFPGYVALIPVAAAVCLIISGSGTSQTIVSRMLSHRYLTSLGGITFTIYLWHWPLLVFYLEYTGAQEAGLWGGALVISCAITLAHLTSRLVEVPLIKDRTVKQHPLAPYLLGAAFSIPAVAAAGALKLHFRSIYSDNGTDSRYLEQQSISVQKDATTISYAQFISAKGRLPKSYLDSCHQNPASPDVAVCEYGDTASNVVVALVGGSHAAQWLPALSTIGEHLGLKVLSITKSYCPLGALQDSNLSCVEWNKRLIGYLAEIQPAVVITNSTRAHKAGVEEHVPESYINQWKALADHGIEVIGIRDNPQFEWDVVHCVVRNQQNPLLCSKALADSLRYEDPAKPLSEQIPSLKLVDMTDYFCTDGTCTAVFNDILMYNDKEHISVPYVNFLTKKLLEQLVRASPRVFQRLEPANQQDQAMTVLEVGER